MKTEIKLWKEYREAVEKHNRPYKKALSRLYRDRAAKHKSDADERERKLKEAQEEWERSSWLYKIFSYRPDDAFYIEDQLIRRISEAGEEMLLSLKHNPVNNPTYETFLDWLANDKKFK